MFETLLTNEYILLCMEKGRSVKYF